MSEFPFVKPGGSDAECFIQWKGTDLCMDLNCRCGEQSHIDSDFVYSIRCPHCGTVYRLGTQVILKVVEDPDPEDSTVKTAFGDEDPV